MEVPTPQAAGARDLRFASKDGRTTSLFGLPLLRATMDQMGGTAVVQVTAVGLSMDLFMVSKSDGA